MVFPADVSASNYQSIPIAVIYDEDGSVIDTLLGEGASDPSGCRQTPAWSRAWIRLAWKARFIMPC